MIFAFLVCYIFIKSSADYFKLVEKMAYRVSCGMQPCFPTWNKKFEVKHRTECGKAHQNWGRGSTAEQGRVESQGAHPQNSCKATPLECQRVPVCKGKLCLLFIFMLRRNACISSFSS